MLAVLKLAIKTILCKHRCGGSPNDLYKYPEAWLITREYFGQYGEDTKIAPLFRNLDKKHGRPMSLNVEAEAPLPPKLGGREIRAGVFIVYDDWLQDKMFDLGSTANRNDVFERYVALQKFFGERNITLHTFDKYDNPSKVDVWLMFEPSRAVFRFIIKNRINPRKVLLFLQEPPTVNPKAWKYLRLYQWAFKTIVTWNTDLCKKSSRFSHNFFPVSFDRARYPAYRDRQKKNFCVLMQFNKDPKVRYKNMELLSLRREVITYFDDRKDNLLNLYGHGWNDPCSHSPFFSASYRGMNDSKRETLADHYFAFCIVNCYAPGYFAYDPFLAMSVGTVPIYYPMADSFKYIPQDTVINMKDFPDYDRLVAHCKELIATGEYEEYRKRGWQFLNSLEYRPFTIDQFCQDIYCAIRKVL